MKKFIDAFIGIITVIFLTICGIGTGLIVIFVSLTPIILPIILIFCGLKYLFF